MSKIPIIIGVVVLLIVIGLVVYFTMMKGEEPTLGPTTGPTAGPAPAAAVAPAAAMAPPVTVVPPPPEGVANVRYVRLERPVPVINLAEVEVFDENDVNVALSKTVTGGPGAAHPAGPFARLVDGSKARSNFAHTRGNGVNFMQIDLGAATTVKKIVITNRLNCCQDRTENMKVILLDASETVLKTTDVVNKGQKEMTMDFSATTPAWEYLPMQA